MPYIAQGRRFQERHFHFWFLKYIPSDVPRFRGCCMTPIKYFSKIGKTRVCSYKLAALWSLSLRKLLIKCLKKSEVKNMLGRPVPHCISHNNRVSRKCVSENGKIDSFVGFVFWNITLCWLSNRTSYRISNIF